MASGSGELYVRERGEGKPIVFIHGWPTSGRVWQYQLEGLSGEHHVLAPDLPGFGDSPPIAEPALSGFAGAIMGLIDARDLTDVFLVGWSLGAGVVMSYCERFGSYRLRAVGIVDDSPKLIPDGDWLAGRDAAFSLDDLELARRRWPSEREAFLREFSVLEFKDPARHARDVEWLVEEGMKADTETALGSLADALSCDFRESVTRIEAPALLLYGAHSPFATAANRSFMERAIPSATLVVFEESGHNPMLEEPEAFNRAVGAFASAV